MMDKLAQLPAREKTGLALALALMALYVADLTLAKPLMRRVQDLDTAIAVEKNRLEHSLKTVSYEQSVEGQYSTVQDLIGASGPEPETIELFKKELDEMAQRNAVRLKSMRHMSPERTEFLITYLIEVGEFEAEVASLINFLNAVSNAPGLIRVRRIVINGQAQDSTVNGSLVITKVMTRSGSEGKP